LNINLVYNVRIDFRSHRNCGLLVGCMNGFLLHTGTGHVASIIGTCVVMGRVIAVDRQFCIRTGSWSEVVVVELVRVGTGSNLGSFAT
jgi:hypothetical protein